MKNYTTAELKIKPEEKDKTVISNEAYAICEFLELLCERLKIFTK